MVDIIVPVYNQSRMTMNCFLSVKIYTTVPYRIIWVDNGSGESNFRYMKELVELENIPHLIIRNSENLGFISAINEGLIVSNNDVVLLNNDVIVSPRWLSKMIAISERQEDIGMVGCITNKSAWQHLAYLNKEWKMNYPTYKGDIEKYNEIIEKLYPKGFKYATRSLSFFCVFLKRKMIDEVGYLNKEFDMGFGDDDDYCHRVDMTRHKRVVSLDTFVEHKFRATWVNLYTADEIRKIQGKNIELLKKKEKEGCYDGEK